MEIRYLTLIEKMNISIEKINIIEGTKKSTALGLSK